MAVSVVVLVVAAVAHLVLLEVEERHLLAHHPAARSVEGCYYSLALGLNLERLPYFLLLLELRYREHRAMIRWLCLLAVAL